jgi:hypothetical protein
MIDFRVESTADEEKSVRGHGRYSAYQARSLSSGRAKASEQASKQASKQASRQASIATLLSLSTTYYGRHHNTAGKDHGISSQIKAFQYAICPLKTPLL